MTFSKVWNELKPAGTDSPSLGDDEIRDFKTAIRERLGVEHKFYASEAGRTDVGRHADGFCRAHHLVPNAVLSDKIMDGAVTTPKITDGAILEAKLGFSCVSTEKLKDNAVTTTKIHPDALEKATVTVELGPITVGTSFREIGKSAVITASHYVMTIGECTLVGSTSYDVELSVCRAGSVVAVNKMKSVETTDFRHVAHISWVQVLGGTREENIAYSLGMRCVSETINVEDIRLCLMWR